MPIIGTFLRVWITAFMTCCSALGTGIVIRVFLLDQKWKKVVVFWRRMKGNSGGSSTFFILLLDEDENELTSLSWYRASKLVFLLDWLSFPFGFLSLVSSSANVEARRKWNELAEREWHFERLSPELSLEIANLSLFPYTGTYEYVRKRNDICEVITFRFRRFMVSLPQLISFPLSVRATLPNEMGAKKFLGFTVIPDRVIHTDLAR